jgi:iron complex transport system substrate-binding protein
MTKLLCLLSLGWALAAHAVEPARVVTLGGSVTEIVYALGEGGRLVGNDLSSLYPEAATRLPRIGYYRAVPVEGVAALKPDLVLASEQAGPPKAIEKLAELGLRIVKVSDTPSMASLDARIRAVAQALGRPVAGEQLVADIHRKLDEAMGFPGKSLRTVMVLNRAGRLQGAGSHTAADAIMEMAGLINVLHDVQKGYQPLSNEGLAALAPDLLLISRSSLPASGRGREPLLTTLGLSPSTLRPHCRIVVVDDSLILGVGPRLPQVIRQLKNEALGGVGG